MTVAANRKEGHPLSDQNNEYCRRLQWEYTAAMDDAFRDRDLNGGKYTKDGLKLLIKAAIAQQNLAARTTGATQSAHQNEYNRLSRQIKQESIRLGVVQPAPVPESPRPPAPQTKPAGAPSAPSAGKPGRSGASDEVGESFNLEDFILPPGDITLDDVHLESGLAEQLRDAIDAVDPISLFPKATKGWKPRPRSNFLFFGPPGTGKSHLCGAINGSLHKNYPGDRSIFYLIDGNKLVSKWRGSTGHRLDTIFQEAEKYEFSIICIDEFEQLCPDRTKLEDKESYTKNFLTLMEGVGGRTSAMVIACTNHPQLLDPAILSRLQKRIFIDYPTEDDIRHFFLDNKQYVDFLGNTPEEAAEVASKLAEKAAARRYSYRNLTTVAMNFGDAVARKTMEAYPHGNAELEHMCPLTLDEAMKLLDSVDSDYDEVQYSIYREYMDKKGSV